MLKIIILLLLLFQSGIFPQYRNKLDSLQNESLVTTGESKLSILFQLAVLSKDSSLNLGFDYSKKAFLLSQKMNLPQAEARALLLVSFYKFLMYKLNESSQYLSKALIIYRTYGDSVGVAKAFEQKGLIMWRSGEFDSALKFYLYALKLYKSANNFEGIATELNYIGLVHWKKGDYPLAIKNFTSSLQIKNDIGNKYEIGLTLNNMGKLYNELNDYTTSAEYSKRALKLSKIIDNKYIRGRALNNLGLSFAGLGEYTKALKYLKKAKVVKQSLKDKIGISFTEHDIGNIYDYLGNYDQALKNYASSLSIRKEIKDDFGVASVLISIAKVQIKNNNLAEAFLSITKSKIISKKIGAKNLVKKCYKVLSEYYAKKSLFRKAYIYYSKYSILKDSLFNDSNSKQIAKMDSRYKVEKVEKEMEALKQQKKFQTLELQREKTVRLFLTFTLIFLLIAAGAIYSQIRLKKKTYTLLKEKNNELLAANKKLFASEAALKELNTTKDKFFSIIAHDLKNPFNSILGFYELIIKEFDDLSDKEKLEYITAMGNSIKNSYSLLENLLQWSRSQMGSININKVKLQLNSLCSSVINETFAQAKNKNIQIVKNCPNNLTVYADRFMIETVIRNLMTNSVKFTNKNGRINLSSQIKNNAYAEIIVEDNGVGITDEAKNNLFKITKNKTTLGTSKESGTGLGLLICKEFVEKNGGKLSVESTLNRGSKFIFTLPLNRN